MTWQLILLGISALPLSFLIGTGMSFGRLFGCTMFMSCLKAARRKDNGKESV
jgi:hypothetical protein